MPLRFHVEFTSMSLRCHLEFTIPLRFRFDISSISLRWHFDFTSGSLRFHFEFTSGKRENTIMRKGKGKFSRYKREKGKGPDGILGPDLTLPRAARARAHARHETISRLATPPNLR